MACGTFSDAKSFSGSVVLCTGLSMEHGSWYSEKISLNESTFILVVPEIHPVGKPDALTHEWKGSHFQLHSVASKDNERSFISI